MFFGVCVWFFLVAFLRVLSLVLLWFDVVLLLFCYCSAEGFGCFGARAKAFRGTLPSSLDGAKAVWGRAGSFSMFSMNM
jgi:hypothetical protein